MCSAVTSISTSRGPPIEIGEYQVHFERHDEVVNVSALDVDREVWLMLLCYPLEARSFAAVAKSISSFALLKHIHEPEVYARLIVKAALHEDRHIPPDVVISMGSGRHTKSFTVPVYVIARQDVMIGPDEQPVPPNGIAHPVPPPAPR